MKIRRVAPSILAVFPILAAGLALNTCSFFLPREEKVPAPPLVSIPPVTYDTLTVAPGTIELTVTVPGTFIYADQAQLSFAPRGGWLKRVTVQIGDRVKAGDLIAELDTAGLENGIAQQKLLVRRAQLAAERTRLLGGDKLQMEMAQIDTDLAGLQLEDLQTQLAQSRLTTPMAGVIVYLLAVLLGVRMDWHPLSLLGVLFAVMLGAAFFSTFSLVIACLVKTRERFMGIGQILTMPLFFASNAIYPIDIMPGWLKLIAHVNPLTYLVDVLRALMLQGGRSSFGLGTDIAVQLGVLVLLVTVATKLYPTVAR